MIEVSAGIIDKGGRILLCQRGEGRNNAHLWEFPGGKREKGETPESCLRRELMEELSLPVRDVKELCVREAQGIRFTFLTAVTDAEPLLTEHEASVFSPPREMLRYAFCPADAGVAAFLAFSEADCYLWDFDGTLADTYPIMSRAFSRTAAHFHIDVPEGRALDLLKVNLTHACQTLSRETGVDIGEIARRFRQEEAELLPTMQPVSGIPELLSSLKEKGGRHYVVTHREGTCRALLDACGLLPLFDGLITGEDGLPRKPDPAMVLTCMARHHLDAGRCVMIGDRPLDTEAGRNAGILSILLDTDDRFPGAVCDLRAKTVSALTEVLCPAFPL